MNECKRKYLRDMCVCDVRREGTNVDDTARGVGHWGYIKIMRYMGFMIV